MKTLIVLETQGNLQEGKEMDNEQVAKLALSLNAVLAEAYLEAGHADPMIYQVIERASQLSRFLEDSELTNDLEFLKMKIGNRVDEIIEENNIPMEKGEWS